MRRIIYVLVAVFALTCCGVAFAGDRDAKKVSKKSLSSLSVLKAVKGPVACEQKASDPKKPVLKNCSFTVQITNNTGKTLPVGTEIWWRIGNVVGFSQQGYPKYTGSGKLTASLAPRETRNMGSGSCHSVSADGIQACGFSYTPAPVPAQVPK